MSRAISSVFFRDFESGILHPILQRIQEDHTLMLAFRDKVARVYYRGGCLLKIEEKSGKGEYKVSFDPNYGKPDDEKIDYTEIEKKLPELPSKINTNDDARKCVHAFLHLKEIMDIFFTKRTKLEREFQQLVVRENNFSRIANDTEYFFTDIEYASGGVVGRFDMLAIRWLASVRSRNNNGRKCRIALIEMKYGDKSFKDTKSPGLCKHLEDMNKFLSDGKLREELREMMQEQFRQLCKLGLVDLKGNPESVKLDAQSKPEVIIVLANSNPRGKALIEVIEEIEKHKFDNFELKFFVSRFAGYGMHAKCMLSLEQFKQYLEVYTQ